MRPEALRLAVGFCFSLQACGGGARNDDANGKPQPGASALPAQCEPAVSPDRAILVDDFEDNDELLDRSANLHGIWYVENDGSGEQSPPAGTERSPGSLLTAPGAPGSARHALHTTGRSFQLWGAYVAVKLNASRAGACVYDLSAHSGLTLSLKGSGSLRVNLGTKTTIPIEDGGDCNSETCSDHGMVLELDTDWRRVDVPFDDLTQPDWATVAAWDPARALRLSVWAEQKDFDFWLDDLRFY